MKETLTMLHCVVCLAIENFLDRSSDSDGIRHLQARGDLGLQMNYTLQILVTSKKK